MSMVRKVMVCLKWFTITLIAAMITDHLRETIARPIAGSTIITTERASTTCRSRWLGTVVAALPRRMPSRWAANGGT